MYIIHTILNELLELGSMSLALFIVLKFLNIKITAKKENEINTIINIIYIKRSKHLQHVFSDWPMEHPQNINKRQKIIKAI